MRRALGAAAVASLWALAPCTAAADTLPLALPLAAPPGADPLTADFVDICSRAMTTFGEAVTLAGARGWNAERDGSALEAAAAAAFGNATMTKDNNALLIQRTDFPHLVATTCMMQMLQALPAGFNPGAISAIPGISGGMLNLAGQQTGRWSFVDKDDHVVTIAGTPIGAERFLLVMSTGARVAPPGSAAGPLKAP